MADTVPHQSVPVPISTFVENSPIVFILVGLVGAGKSTFAQALEEHYPNFRRCNQDELGDRRSVESLVRACLRDGLSVCVDRTNFNESQRAYWINIAREFPGTAVWVLVFDTPYEECARRLQQRTGHPTILSPEQGMSILSRFSSDYRPPSPFEGYDRIISLSPSEHPSDMYTFSDVTDILCKVQRSPPVTIPARQDYAFRGRGFRQFNGRGPFRGYFPTRPRP